MRWNGKIGQIVCLLMLGMGVIILCVSANTAAAETVTLRVLGWEGFLYEGHHQPFIDQVNAKYGIDLKFEFAYVKGDDDFFTAVRDGKADIINPSNVVPKDKRFQLIAMKLVLPLNLENIPNFKNIVPAWQRSEYWTEGDVVYGIPVNAGPYALAYNTGILAEAPVSWNIFWDPRFKDKYALGKDQYEQNVYITALAMGMSPQDMSDYKKVNTPEFQEKLAQLAINAHSFWEGSEKAEDLKGLAVAAIWGPGIQGLKALGETWKFAEPKEGMTGYVAPFLIGSSLENQPQLKQIAEEWFNYLLSDDMQLLNIREISCEPVTITVKNLLTPEEVAQFHLDDPAYFEQHRMLWPVLDKLDRKGLERLWNEAMAKRK